MNFNIGNNIHPCLLEITICYSTIYNTIQSLGPKYFLLVKAWLNAWRCRSMDDITDSCIQIKLVQLANFMVLVIRKEIAFLMHLTCFLAMSHVSYVFQIIKKVLIKPTVVFPKILYWNIIFFSKNSKIYEYQSKLCILSLTTYIAEVIIRWVKRR